AAHHAGLLPAFKEVVEELFVRGLVKAVFATETLALGINMPARCVVLERLVKYNGEAHVDLTPGEYTQLTGRAGRRGIDVEGHAVAVWAPEVDPRHVAGLASTRTYPLRSSFRPSYNMAVNLVGSVGTAAARELLDPGSGGFGEPRPLVLTEDRWAGRIAAGDFATPVEALTRVRVPKHFNHRSPQERRDLAATLRNATADRPAARRPPRARGPAAD